MNHWIIAPVVIPAFAAAGLLLGARLELRTQRVLSSAALVGLLGVAGFLLSQAAGGSVQTYRLGGWPAPFGIVLVLDRLSGLMVLLTSVLALLSHLYAIHGWDERGANYHCLFHFQLMGLNGAFLTGDLFNLFVFFEILLIASYGLLLHGDSDDQLRAGIHYVVFNLVGSALFLIGVGLLYAVTGTLNMADLAVKVAETAPADLALVRAGGLVLLVVFSVKAALLPLYFWLPAAYSSATAPVAALFAIMTKVGVYAILRVFLVIFGPGAGAAAGLAEAWLLPLALATLALGTLGVMASPTLRGLVSYLVIASVGTMLTAVALGRADSVAAAIYYMAHSTLVLAGLFLIADLIARQRGDAGDRLERATAVAQPALLGGLFLTGGVAVVGLPPLSGFVGKALILESAVDAPAAPWVFGVVLVTGLLTLVALSRAGSTLFWNADEEGVAGPAADVGALLPAAVLLLLTVAMTILAGPIVDYTGATAQQLLEPDAYIDSVLHDQDVMPAAPSGPGHGAATGRPGEPEVATGAGPHATTAPAPPASTEPVPRAFTEPVPHAITGPPRLP